MCTAGEAIILEEEEYEDRQQIEGCDILDYQNDQDFEDEHIYALQQKLTRC